MKEKTSLKATGAALFFSLPWCCILPALFSLLSVGTVMASRLFLQKLNPLFFVVSLVFLSRALFLHFVRGEGAKWAKGVTLASALFVGAYWLYRFSYLFS